MNHTVPGILRRLIDVLEAARYDKAESEFICDQLRAPGALSKHVNRADRDRALDYLRELGMGDGFTVFYTVKEEKIFENYGFEVSKEEQLLRRQAWLSFAADLYEEGVR